MACRCSSAGAGCSCVVIEADTPTLDQHVTGTGDGATPFVVSGDVKRSAAAGNTLVINPDGLYVPPPGPAVLPAPGCGLRAAGATWEADTVPFASLTRRNCNDQADQPGTTPLPAGCEANGMGVYCASDGTLRTMPEKFTEVAAAAVNEALNVTRADLPFRSSPIQVSLTNPSSCYCMCGYLVGSFIPGISAAPNAVVNLFHEWDLGLGTGFSAATTGNVFDTRGKVASSGMINRPTASLQVCLDPGETKVIQYRVAVETFTGDNGAAAILMTALARDLRYVGSNL
jgi:hypothetical protein